MRRSNRQATKSHRAYKIRSLTSNIGWTGAVALVSGALGLPAQTKPTTVPDAQVESNVLQALAKNPKLANEQISSTTVYGIVTLSGHVADEPTRALAENVVARTAGVSKVVDELTLSTAATATASSDDSAQVGPPAAVPSSGAAEAGQQGTDPVLQSDGSYAPASSATPSAGSAASPAPSGQPDAVLQGAPVERGDAPAVAGQQQPAYGHEQFPQAGPGQPEDGQATPGTAPNQGGYPQQPGAPSSQPGAYGQPGQYGQSGPYGQPGPYGQQRPYAPPPPYSQQGRYAAGPNPQVYGRQGAEGPGQQGGVRVTVPAGTTIQLRVNQPIDSRHSPVGSSFSGVLQQDIVVGGYVALPRGASLQGTVVDASSAGPLKGRAELGLQLTQLTLGGLTYPVSSNLWSQAGGDKAVRSVNSALGLGVVGAIIGGVAGGGAGAAIGAGAGGAAGLGASAASGGDAVVVPPESLLTFHLNSPLEVTTVPQAELNRLAYNVPALGYGPPRVVRRYPAYYPYGPGYYGPGYYYPRYYRGYPY